MKISIIVPIYKTEDVFLRKCIDSLRNQTMKDIEIILVDDGTPDNCGAICDEYSMKDDRIVVIHKDNEGVSIARNVGVEKATGQYIMFVDADDILDQRACEVSFKAISKKESDILIFKYTVSKELKSCTGNIEQVSDNKKQFQIAVIDSNYNIDNDEYPIASPWAKLFRRDFLCSNKIEFFPHLKKAQDRVFMLHCLEFTKEIIFLDYMGYFYNEHPSSVCRNYNPKIKESTDKLVEIIDGFISKFHCSEQEFINASNSLKVNVTFEVIYLYFFHEKCDMPFYKKYKAIKELITEAQIHDVLKTIDISRGSNSEKVILLMWKNKLLFTSCIFLGIKQGIRRIIKK